MSGLSSLGDRRVAVPSSVATSVDSATGLDASSLSVGAGLSGTVEALASSAALATTIDGTAASDASVTQAVASLNSPLSVGDQATLLAVESGLITASASTVNGTIAAAHALFDDGSAGGSPVAGLFGGVLDTAATAVDLSLGGSSRLEVQVANTASASASNTGGDATSRAALPSSDGLLAITAEIGSAGSVQVQVDADLTATATTVGIAVNPADATARAEASRVAAITAVNDAGSDPSSLRFGADGVIEATAGSAADPVTLTASATSVSGAAAASTELIWLAGITDSYTAGGVIQAGDDLTIEAGAALDQSSNASSVAADATATGNVLAVFGTQLGSLSSGADTDLDSRAVVSLASRATSSDGAATATNELFALEGAWLADTLVSQSADLNARATAELLASASNVGDAIADATASSQLSSWLVGLETPGPLRAGSDAEINAAGALEAEASASSVAGAASAKAASFLANVRGFSNITSYDPIEVGGELTLQGTATSRLQSGAETIGTAADPARAAALVGGEEVTPLGRFGNVALEISGLSLSVGEEASLNGSATLAQSATARAVSGDVLAGAFTDRSIGIQTNTALEIGGDARIEATALQGASVSANTVQGASEAVVASATNAALLKDASSFPLLPAPTTAGGSLTLQALSATIGSASATSVDAGSGTVAAASVNQDRVYGISLAGGDLDAGDGASITTTASSLQQAAAGNIGPAAGSNSGGASAAVAGSDQIFAVDAVNLNVGADLSGFAATARLAGQASSSNVRASGLSEARAGAAGTTDGTLVLGVTDAQLTIGGDTAPDAGINVLAAADLQAKARGVAGEATAAAGDDAARVIGIRDTQISAGGRVGLTSAAESTLRADAGSVTDDVTGSARQATIGLLQTGLSAGDDARLAAVAQLSNTVLSSTVLGDASTTLASLSQGINDNMLAIGDSAVISSRAVSEARGVAQSVLGSV
ncbi:MAG: hypothetical protein VKI83_07935 [Synechococcaceae cyanobacterium]|nr:hypothetical protein [Synechococcaceae cyanobacterium]